MNRAGTAGAAPNFHDDAMRAYVAYNARIKARLFPMHRPGPKIMHARGRRCVSSLSLFLYYPHTRVYRAFSARGSFHLPRTVASVLYAERVRDRERVREQQKERKLPYRTVHKPRCKTLSYASVPHITRTRARERTYIQINIYTGTDSRVGKLPWYAPTGRERGSTVRYD